MFVLAHLAFSTPDTQAMRQVVQLAVAEAQFSDPLVAALAWLDFKDIEQPLRLIGRSESPDHRRLAIAVQAAHRVRAEEDYERGAMDANPALRARALRAIGETKSLALASILNAGTRDPELRCRFWAAWSMALMGDERAGAVAFEAGIGDPVLTGFALEIGLRAGDQAWARAQVQSLAQAESTLRPAIVAAGMFGDPAVVPWLLTMLERPAFARVAAEAFASITGVDLEDARFKQDAPEDAPEEHDDDSDLRWPSPEGLLTWWRSERGRFQPGTRYLAGAPISEAAALHVLRSGYQRQRRGAAIEVARLRKDAILFPTVARADRQQRRLQV
jgi:uncharacterized protein (TIGR02270 family)